MYAIHGNQATAHSTAITYPQEPLAVPDTSSLMPITSRPEAVMVRGEGSYLFDHQGKRYLDFIQGWAVNALGHCPPEVTSALQSQAATLISPSPALHNLPQLQLAALITDASGLAQVHFANSGAQANEAAVKLARKWGQQQRAGAYQVITTHGGFHGRTLAMMAASGKAAWDKLFPPLPEGFIKVPYGDPHAIAQAITAQTVAIMVEPIQGEAGVVVPPPGYLKALRSIADEHGVLLIVDEVQTGIGRTGALFAHQHESIAPDIMTLGKGLGGGVPLSAMAAAAKVCCFEPGDQGGTFNGSPLMSAVGKAVFETVSSPSFLAAVKHRGEQLRRGLNALGEVHGFTEVRGAGLLLAVRLSAPNAAHVAAKAMAQTDGQGGLLLNAAQPDVLRLMPSLRVSEEEITLALTLLDRALSPSTTGRHQ